MSEKLIKRGDVVNVPKENIQFDPNTGYHNIYDDNGNLIANGGINLPETEVVYRKHNPYHPTSQEDILSPITSYPKNVEKRAIETAMKTTPAENPIPEIKEYWKRAEPLRRDAIIRYILFGLKTGEEGYYNSLFPSPPNYYNGYFWGPDMFSGEYIPDMGVSPGLIDAYLYGTTPTGYTKLDKPDYGPIWEEYLNTHPLYRNLNTYYTGYGLNYNLPYDEVNTIDESMPIGNSSYVANVAGHRQVVHALKPDDPLYDEITLKELLRLQKEGFDEASIKQFQEMVNNRATIPFFNEYDIWKFNPDDYMDKWTKNGKHAKYKKLMRKGLERVDKAGKPFISTTGWYWQKHPKYMQHD